MSESNAEPGIVDEIHTPHRVAELEIEVARLVAELDEARGGDPTAGASRFLSIAASTIDQAVSEVTNEAEEAVAQLRSEIEESQLEARHAVAAARAEAEAAQAAAGQVTVDARRELEEARTSAMTLAEEAAARADKTARLAQAEAEQILAMARNEATMAMVSERQRFTREVNALSGVREALVKERHALEQYHLQLQARVRELAQAMMSFMTNTTEGESLDALVKLTIPAIEAPPESHTAPSMPPASEQAMADVLPAGEQAMDDVLPARPVVEPVTVDEVTDPVAASPDTTEPEPPDPRSEESPGPRSEESPDPRPEDLFSDEFGHDPSGDSAPAELESPMPFTPLPHRPVVEAITPEPEPEQAAAAVSEQEDPTATQEDPWRQVDPSEDPPRPVFGAPVAVPMPSLGNDLFAPAIPGEGSNTEPGGLDQLVAEVDGGDVQVEIETSTTAQEDAQFQDFIDGDDDDASRSWLLRSDKR